MPIPAPGNVDAASQTTLNLVKAKTDTLPASPANETTLAAVKTQTDKINGMTFNNVGLASGGTSVLPKGFWTVQMEPSATPYGTIDMLYAADGWFTAAKNTVNGLTQTLFSDGTNVRINNAGNPSSLRVNRVGWPL